MGAAGVPGAVVAPQLHPPLRGACRVSTPLHWSSVGRPGRARGIAFLCVGAEGHQGWARACHARLVLMCLRELAWLRGSPRLLAMTNVVRPRKSPCC